MRKPSVFGRKGLLLLVMMVFISVKYIIDQRYLKLRGKGSEVVTQYEEKVGGSCSPKKQVAFAKTHKTGGSTLQNIFFRYGDEHGLMFGIPEKSWTFPFTEPFNASMITEMPWFKFGIDLFIFHSIWSYNEVMKVLPDAVYITLLRDPVHCYESNYVYMGVENVLKMNFSEFVRIMSAERPYEIRKDMQLWDLGMPFTDIDDELKVGLKISDLNNQFDFVLIAEYFDESLVLLARLLCWNLSDVRYLKQNARKAEKISNITEETQTQLQGLLSSDYRLYNNYLAKFQLEVERFGREKLDRDVATLRQLNEELTKECVKEVADNSKLTGEFRTMLDIVEGYVMDTSKPWCAAYARNEVVFTNQLRNQQISMVEGSPYR